MSEPLDINSLSKVQVDLTTTTTNNLDERYDPYSLYVEDRAGEDIQGEYNTNLYDLYNAGIDNLVEDGWKITIGEEISSHRQMWLSNNFDTINREFGEVDDVIEYNKINTLASKINDKQSYKEISTAIFNFITDDLGIDFTINPNPENSDNSNLILTQKTRQKIQPIVESILNKVYRNLVQLIRVKHDYRLYGVGSTVFAGTSKLSSEKNLGAWSSLPSSCWKQYTGNYLVGEKVYNNESTGDVGHSGIKNSRTALAPYKVFGIQAHNHNVSVSIGSLPDKVEGTKTAVKGGSDIRRDEASHIDDGTKCILWSDAVKDSLLPGLHPKGFGRISEKKGSVSSSASWKYSWNTNSYCKLMSKPEWLSNIFDKELSNLPTYVSRVWKWTGTDDTNITSPKKDISATVS